MTPRIKLVSGWVAAVLGGGLGLAIIGMAAQFWISTEVKAQLTDHIAEMTASIPDTAQLTTDVEVIKSTVVANGAKADIAIANQQRFEEIFMEYLRNEANR